jgi:hypothetical protein
VSNEEIQRQTPSITIVPSHSQAHSIALDALTGTKEAWDSLALDPDQVHTAMRPSSGIRADTKHSTGQQSTACEGDETQMSLTPKNVHPWRTATRSSTVSHGPFLPSKPPALPMLPPRTSGGASSPKQSQQAPHLSRNPPGAAHALLTMYMSWSAGACDARR